MKSASAALVSHLQQEVTTLATLWRVERQDGEVFRFTDHDADISIDVPGSPSQGVETFRAAIGYSRTGLRNTSALRPENVELEGLIDDDTVKAADLSGGLFDGAWCDIFLVNWADTSMGTMYLKSGRFGSVEIGDAGYKVEFVDLAEALDTVPGDVYAVDCIVDLGDTRCGVRLDPPTWQASTVYTLRQARDAATGSVVKPTTANGYYFKCTSVADLGSPITTGTSGGSEPSWNLGDGATTDDGDITWTAFRAHKTTGNVTSVTDRRNFADSGRTEPDDFWQYGLLTWTTGNNIATRPVEVELFGDAGGSPSNGAFKLKFEMPFDIKVGDAYSITVGCDKFATTCRDKFDNIENFQGYGTFVPGNEAILRTPDAK